jgi:plastocyanin
MSLWPQSAVQRLRGIRRIVNSDRERETVARMERRSIVAVGIALLAAACGSDGGGMPPSPPTATTTITITSSGVSPKNVVVSPGAQVTFVNNDSRDHEIDSDPHPTHTDCPALNTVDFIVPGQSKQTGNLNDVGTCGFHDHMRPEDAALHGAIKIQ